MVIALANVKSQSLEVQVTPAVSFHLQHELLFHYQVDLYLWSSNLQMYDIVLHITRQYVHVHVSTHQHVHLNNHSYDFCHTALVQHAGHALEF